MTDSTRLTTTLFAYQMDTNLRLQSFDRNRFPAVDYARIPDESGLFFRQTSNLRNRVYDVAGLSTELETRFSTGSVDHKAVAGVRGIGEITRRKLSIGGFPTALSGDLQTDDTTRIAGIGAWLQDQIAFSDVVVVTPAFRLEHSETGKRLHRVADDTRAPYDVDRSASSRSTGAMPGLALSIGKPALNVFSSMHVGYSAPRISQSITPDGKDANLDAENSSNYEVGARGRLGKWLRAEADGFLVNFDNQLVSNNPLSGFTSEFINGGRTRHAGIEGTASVRFGEGLKLPIDLDWSANYTYVRSRFVGGTFAGKAIPYAPPHTLQTTIDAAHPIGVSAQAAFSYVAPQYTDERNTVEPGPTGLDGRIPAFTTVDIGARYRHKRTGLSLGIAVKNLLDRVYISDRLPNGIFTAMPSESPVRLWR
ncbi:MAG: TonB-dependent receptor [Proteobacteria bacterium]|nr:MAG: TonB-dependent receptor [Pseudomonadota bacterium]